MGYTLNTESLSDVKYGEFFKKYYDRFENYAGDIEKFSNYIKYEHSYRCFNTRATTKDIIMKDMMNALEKFPNLREKYGPPPGMFL